MLLNLLVVIKLLSLLQMTNKRFKLWSCQKVWDALIYLFDNIFIRCDTKLHRQFVGIPMGTYCAPLTADSLVWAWLAKPNIIIAIPIFNPCQIIYGEKRGKVRRTACHYFIKRPVKIMYLGLDRIIKLKFTTNFNRCAI